MEDEGKKLNDRRFSRIKHVAGQAKKFTPYNELPEEIDIPYRFKKNDSNSHAACDEPILAPDHHSSQNQSDVGKPEEIRWTVLDPIDRDQEQQK